MSGSKKSVAKKDNERYSVVCRHCGKGYKAISASHLQRKHGYQGEHPILDYKKRFGLDWAFSGETLAAMRANSKARHEEWLAKWPSERVLAVIQQKFAEVKAGKPYARDGALTCAAPRGFGSFRAATRKAGVGCAEVAGEGRW